MNWYQKSLYRLLQNCHDIVTEIALIPIVLGTKTRLLNLTKTHKNSTETYVSFQKAIGSASANFYILKLCGFQKFHISFEF